MKKALVIIIFSLFTIQSLSAQNNVFIENQGQWDDKILFVMKQGNQNVIVTKTGILFDQFKRDSLGNIQGNAIKLSFDNSNLKEFEPKFKAKFHYNFIIGKYQSYTNVPAFNEIVFKEIYNDVDLRLYKKDKFRFDLIIKDQSAIDKIKLNFQGHQDLKINNDNNITVATGISDLKIGGLRAFLKENNMESVDCEFKKISKSKIGFNLGKYDVSKPFVIDPFVVYSSYFGTGGSEDCGGACTDNNGNIYICGSTDSRNFPITPGAYKKQIEGIYHGFFTKFSPDGKDILYSTYFGPEGCVVTDIKVNKDGFIYIAGTVSFHQATINFPISDNAFQKTYSGDLDFYITKFNSKGNQVIASTFLGGSDFEEYCKLRLFNNRVFLYVATKSKDMPVSENAFMKSIDDTLRSRSLHISVLTDNLENMIGGTYLGGKWGENIGDIEVDDNGNILVCGVTTSEEFPTTENTYQPEKNSVSGFVAKLNSDLSDLIFSSYTETSWNTDIFTDKMGNIYITGRPESKVHPPVSDNAYQKPEYSEQFDMWTFICKFNYDFTEFIAGSTLNNGWGNKILQDEYGNIILLGSAYLGEVDNRDFPVTKDAFKKSSGDLFITMFNQDFSDLRYSTLFAGIPVHGDMHSQIVEAFYDNKTLIIVGNTAAYDFPVTDDAMRMELLGMTDMFISVLDFNIVSAEYKPELSADINCYPNPITNTGTIEFSIEKPANIKFSLFDITGRLIKTIGERYFSAGEHIISIDAANIPAGNYYLRMENGEQLSYKTVKILKE